MYNLHAEGVLMTEHYMRSVAHQHVSRTSCTTIVSCTNWHSCRKYVHAQKNASLISPSHDSLALTFSGSAPLALLRSLRHSVATTTV